MGLTTAPDGFTQDADNGNVYWGPTISDGYFLALAWTTGVGLRLHVDVEVELTPEEAVKLGTDIALMTGRMRDLS
ncbi:hypothetical protein D6T63_04190 [Arthrobacter cheniae]|uniref:Uncharacterized protein n=1 Tax=Arthrobacter cheniae TaxID=1258888 RepID=A0A3A5M600_9MICC|nr:hypothetical protein [Arthrobacter cheniae]RJT81954.1 hypothetical protein D6T63_04190 [Arthrobacter cheniae]